MFARIMYEELPNKIGRYKIWLDGDGTVLGESVSNPLYEGAKALQKRGFTNDTLITTRQKGRDYDNWNPPKLGTVLAAKADEL